MAIVLALIGTLLVLGGGFWTVRLFSVVSPNPSAGEALGVMMGAVPGLSAVGTGLLFLGIAAILFRLAAIHREARNVTDEIESLRAALLDRR